MLKILDGFLRYEFWCTVIQSRDFASDFEFLIGLNEY